MTPSYYDQWDFLTTLRCFRGCSDSESLDKNAAREQAMKHLGLYKKDNQQKPAVAPLPLLPSEAVREVGDRAEDLERYIAQRKTAHHALNEAGRTGD